MIHNKKYIFAAFNFSIAVWEKKGSLKLETIA